MSVEKELLNTIEASEPSIEVVYALHDQLGQEEAGILTHGCPDALVGTRLLNVSTAIMDCLRKFPERPIIETPIDIDEPEDRLARYTLRLLNDSVKRPVFPRLPRYVSEKVRKLGTCGLAEETFLDASYPDASEPSLYFIDSAGHIVMFKKEAGQPSAINLKPIQINNVRYPAGTLLNIEESDDIQTTTLSGFRIATIDPANISGIAPLRFTLFAFSPKDRSRYLTPVEGYELTNSDYLNNPSTFSDLTMRAPKRDALRAVYDYLHLKTDELE